MFTILSATMGHLMPQLVMPGASARGAGTAGAGTKTPRVSVPKLVLPKMPLGQQHGARVINNGESNDRVNRQLVC